MTTRMTTLHDLFVRELRDLLYAEKRLARELPRMARAADDAGLQAAFSRHARETSEHVTRLQRVFAIIGLPPKPERCQAIDGLLKEAAVMQAAADGSSIRDAALIASAQRIEHYEIAAYGCARAFANHLRFDKAVDLLDQTLNEEGAADKALTDIALRRVNTDAAAPVRDDPTPRQSAGRRRRRRAAVRALAAS